MKVLNDYVCDKCNTVQERFLDGEVIAVDCACGNVARKVTAAPRVALDGTDPSFPGAYDRWARVREENARIRAKKSYAGE